MTPETVQNGLMAFFAGLIISPHCVAMCGPLYCSLLPLPVSTAASDAARALYHTGRVLAYTLLGALAGGLGLGLVKLFGLQPIRYFPYALLAFLLAFAFRLDRFLPPIPGLKPVLSRLARAFHRLPQPLAALGLGIASPALPCAPLYSIFWVAMVSGSPLFGAEIAAGFAFGTVPLLWLSQEGFRRLGGRLRPGLLPLLQRSLAGLAAALIVWRLVASGGDPLAVGVCALH